MSRGPISCCVLLPGSESEAENFGSDRGQSACFCIAVKPGERLPQFVLNNKKNTQHKLTETDEDREEVHQVAANAAAAAKQISRDAALAPVLG